MAVISNNPHQGILRLLQVLLCCSDSSCQACFYHFRFFHDPSLFDESLWIRGVQGHNDSFTPKTSYHSKFLPPSANCRKMRFPAAKCTFLQKNALSSRKMRFPAEKCTFLEKNAAFGEPMAGNCRKLQDGFRAQESRTLANFYKTPVGNVRKMTQHACSCLHCDSSSRHCRRSSAKQVVWCSSLVASCPVHWQPL